MIRLSMERNLALKVEAEREQEQNAAEAGRIANAAERFALVQRQVVFCLSLLVTVVSLIALSIFAFTNPEPAKVLLSGAATVGGILSLLFRRTENFNGGRSG
jgi:hypothetical protein